MNIQLILQSDLWFHLVFSSDQKGTTMVEEAQVDIHGVFGERSGGLRT